MPTFLAVYHGQTIAEAQMVAVTADPALVADVASRLLQNEREREPDTNPITAALNEGRRQALRLVQEGLTP